MPRTVSATEHREAEQLLEQIASFAGPSIVTGPLATAPDNSTAPDALERTRGWQPDLRYRSLVEKLPAVTFMANLDERKQELYVSPQIEALLGFARRRGLWLIADEVYGRIVYGNRPRHPSSTRPRRRTG